MSQNNTNQSMPSQQKNIIAVNSNELPICCPPKNQAQWNLHPRVYLTFENSTTANCPYCGNQFELQAG